MNALSNYQWRTAFAYFILFFCLLSCKKEGAKLFVREIRAVAVYGNGNVVNFDVNQPPKASLGQSWYGGSTFINVTNEANAAIYIDVQDTSGLGGVSVPGTYPTPKYNYHCEFKPNVFGQQNVSYDNLYSSNHGSITFTRLESNWMEGNFSAVCKYGMDSVTVVGTFKGEF